MKLTYNQMAAKIKNGESISLNGKIIGNLKDLPSQVEVSKGDPEQAALMASAILKRMQADKSVYDALMETAKIGQASEATATSPFGSDIKTTQVGLQQVPTVDLSKEEEMTPEEQARFDAANAAADEEIAKEKAIQDAKDAADAKKADNKPPKNGVTMQSGAL